jgi:hypothetical protein
VAPVVRKPNYEMNNSISQHPGREELFASDSFITTTPSEIFQFNIEQINDDFLRNNLSKVKKNSLSSISSLIKVIVSKINVWGV